MTYYADQEWLPDFVKDVRLRPDGVRELTYDEDLCVAEKSLSKFPALSLTSNELDFRGATILESGQFETNGEGADKIRASIERWFSAGGSLTLSWGTFGIPSIALPAEVASDHAVELFDCFDAFRLISLSDATILECTAGGDLTVAAIPS